MHHDKLATLVDAVHCHPSLAWLDLSEKAIGPDTCEALVSLLMEDIDGIAGTTTSHLAGLTLIGGGIQDAEVTRLASALYSNSIIFIIFCLSRLSAKRGTLPCFSMLYRVRVQL